jgi:hypothetical protein
MNIDFGIQGIEFSPVRGEMVVAKITDVDRLSAMMGKLMGAGAADA